MADIEVFKFLGFSTLSIDTSDKTIDECVAILIEKLTPEIIY